MASQQVNFTNYLAACILDLANLESKEVAIVPANAEVTHLSIEVLEPSTKGATIDIGIEGEPQNLGNDLDLATKKVHTQNVAFSPKTNTKIIVSPNGDDGVIKVRISYFLPSKIMHEF